jgi:hypothetical protein
MAAVVTTAGCTTNGNEDDGRDTATPTSTTLPPPSDTTEGQSDTQASATSQGATMGSADTSGSASDSGGPIIFDLGGLPDAPPSDMGCRKVDFLFAIDNSGSMSAQQTQLLNSFQGFIDAIQASLEDTVDSYHVGVVSSDNYWANAPGCQTLGDLVTQNDTGAICTPFAEGGRFATEMDDLSAKFPCMARVGSSGSPIEQPVSAAIAAVSDAKAAPGACNDGFLRDDAILVLVVLTDDPPYDPDFDDAHPGTNTTGWYQAIVDAKNGDPEAMVVIGFIPWNNVSCVVFNIESPNLIGFVDAFGDQGVKASICEPDFGPIFAQTVETIVTTCQNFDPPG